MRGRDLIARAQRSFDRWLDPALAIALWVAAEIEVLTSDYLEGPAWANAIALAFLTLPVAWRRRWPLGVLVFLTATAAFQTLVLTDVREPGTLVYYLILVPYTAGAYLDRRRAAIGLTTMLAFSVALSVRNLDDLIFTTIFIAGSWLVGRAARARRLLTVELEEKAARIERERESRARLAVADERTRIARELHAVVANSVSEMVVEAEAADRLLEHDLSAAEDAMEHVEERGRQALREMRRILGVLRRGDEGAELAPQPGIGQIPALIEQGRADGLNIEMKVEGEPAPVPAGIDLTAYRIAAGALANLREHAPDARAGVVVHYREDDVELEFWDLGPSEGRIDDRAAIVLRERVGLFGGELSWGQRPGGGYEVRATLPRAYEEMAA